MRAGKSEKKAVQKQGKLVKSRGDFSGCSFSTVTDRVIRVTVCVCKWKIHRLQSSAASESKQERTKTKKNLIEN